ncbi:DNA (cytosine-5-)-methyltransferase [Candidatus Nanosyncoccus alces]|uniref:Cytosine-specific methyltransferase n=1 Tax=Candidatus Nanosyncoccus alces TaxID=2171997 RepID=A0ABY0FMH8_9BACT|nr:DNA (cytosine-5-)-methyltransferase [Candidatus Nanosyncoccus alces]RYC74378.1 Modification methylase HpaII [Candidatus Nanosyncoccus alces]
MEAKRTIRVASLFAGIGGICQGFLDSKNKKAKYEIAWANEIDPYACETYRKNFSHPLIEGDINFVLHPENSDDIEKYTELHEQALSEPIDVINGGFPCQAFSIAGERKGFDDERGNLFMSFIDLINQLDEKFHKKPRVLFLENVKNLKAHDHGRTYKVIKSKLEDCGYTVKEAVLNTMSYSELPQNRERIYIMCFLNKDDADKFTLYDNLDKFKRTFDATERATQIKNIIDYSVDDPKYFYTKEKYPHYFMTEEEFAKNGSKDGIRINLEEDITEMYQFYQLRRGQYVRKNQSNVCPTLTANMGTGGHNVPLILTPNGIRKLTPEETFRLQGLPAGRGYVFPTSFNGTKTYGNSHLYKQAGNAVSVPVIKMIAEQILDIIK